MIIGVVAGRGREAFLSSRCSLCVVGQVNEGDCLDGPFLRHHSAGTSLFGHEVLLPVESRVDEDAGLVGSVDHA